MRYQLLLSIFLLCIIVGGRSRKCNVSSFPKWFHFGVGTSAFQIEGAWNESGKGLSIWDIFNHEPNRIDNNDTADVACDSYHRLDQDLAMIKQLGVTSYRFSISWPRLFPYGTTNYVNPSAVAYYNSLIDGLHAIGVKPMVTLFHWDTPQDLQELGGWTNELIVDWYVAYADKCFELFGVKVKTWTTMNEPANYCTLGYSSQWAPGVNSSGVGVYICAHNIIKAHVKTYRLYQTKYKATQGGKIGISLDCVWSDPIDPNNPQDRYAAQANIEFHFGWFAYPIFKTGDYPLSMRMAIDYRSKQQGYTESRLPRFTLVEKATNVGSCDFIGLNHYTTVLVKFDNQTTSMVPSMKNDKNIVQIMNSSWPKTSSPAMTIVPESLTKNLVWIKNNLGKHIPIDITENGYAGYPQETLNDTRRCKYINLYTQAVLNAMSQGCKVVAYTYWSLMDNFEWTNGYSKKFGLFHVDFTVQNRTRTARRSVYVYKNIITTRKVDNNYIPPGF